MEDLKIAAVCMHCVSGRIEKNLGRAEVFAREASERGADILCFPEFSLSGYVLEAPEKVFSQAVFDQATGAVIEIARRNNLIIAIGMIEACPGQKPFITQIIAGPEGLLGIHRKTHLSPPEREKYQPGRTLGIHRLAKTALGVQLCYEAHFPEISTVMALEGAEVILMPHASPHGEPGQKFESWLRHLPSRAFDNSLFVAACNQVGRCPGAFSFPGVAVILSPLGRILASYRGNKEAMITADLSGEELKRIKAHRMRYFLPNRRPELYRTLTRHSGGENKKRHEG